MAHDLRQSPSSSPACLPLSPLVNLFTSRPIQSCRHSIITKKNSNNKIDRWCKKRLKIDFLCSFTADCKEMWSNGARKSFDYLTVNEKATVRLFSLLTLGGARCRNDFGNYDGLQAGTNCRAAGFRKVFQLRQLFTFNCHSSSSFRGVCSRKSERLAVAQK